MIHFVSTTSRMNSCMAPLSSYCSRCSPHDMGSFTHSYRRYEYNLPCYVGYRGINLLLGILFITVLLITVLTLHNQLNCCVCIHNNTKQWAFTLLSVTTELLATFIIVGRFTPCGMNSRLAISDHYFYGTFFLGNVLWYN